ncbi:hypothetical protein PoB_007415000 [Plakobranchus ocellatus]|uniref:Uncharacterized protein n=1 Tax=Plakobranchus ocellatus TaxID=259542 RepID=A0AAV4DUK2_9GAST|nr:hypothetical protein PoB_007415000 [Plakobranchus ocellatus]
MPQSLVEGRQLIAPSLVDGQLIPLSLVERQLIPLSLVKGQLIPLSLMEGQLIPQSLANDSTIRSGWTTDSTFPVGATTSDSSMSAGEMTTDSTIPDGRSTDSIITGGSTTDSTIPDGGKTTDSNIHGGKTTDTTIPLSFCCKLLQAIRHFKNHLKLLKKSVEHGTSLCWKINVKMNLSWSCKIALKWGLGNSFSLYISVSASISRHARFEIIKYGVIFGVSEYKSIESISGSRWLSLFYANNA